MKIQRIIAAVLSIMMVFLSIPFSRIESSADTATIAAGTKINVEVGGLDATGLTTTES